MPYDMIPGSKNKNTEGTFSEKNAITLAKFQDAYLSTGGDIKQLQQISKQAFTDGKVNPRAVRMVSETIAKAKKKK
tara:strand:- start:71 stop:298 length:228 start_codon:yes stop_codon:yes gene_type:complete